MTDRLKRILWLILRLALMAALVAYVLSQVNLQDTVQLPAKDANSPKPPPMRVVRDAPGIGTVVADVDGGERLIPHEDFAPDKAVRLLGILSIGRRLADHWWLAMAALAVMLLQSPVGAIRWRMLLAVQGIHISMWESMRLTYIGWFFNNWLPGATGGDIVKAYYIAKQTNHKPEAVTVVFLDRLIGLIAMCMLGAAAVVACYHDPYVRPAKYAVTAFLACVSGGALVFYSHRLRALLGLRYIKSILPMRATLDRVDSALFVYRYHKGTVLISIMYSWLTQVVSVLAIWWLAIGLGSHAAWYQYFVTMPVIWIVWSAIPIPGGFGVAEGMTKMLFGAAVLGVAADQAATLAFAMILAYRLVQVVVSAPGGVLYWMQRTHVSTREMRDAMEKPDDAAKPAKPDEPAKSNEPARGEE